MSISDRDDGEIDPEIEADDDEYNQRRRVKAINDARQDFVDASKQIRLMEVDSHKTTPSTAEQAHLLHELLEAYLLELEWLVSEHPEGEHYWFERPLGTIEIPAPTPEQLDLEVYGDLRFQEVIHPLTGERCSEVPTITEEVSGLQSLLELDPPITITYQVKCAGPYRQPEWQTADTHWWPSKSLIREGYRVANEFAGNANLGVEIMDEQQDHSQPFRDV